MVSFFKIVRIAVVSMMLLPFYSTVMAQDAAPAELAPVDKPLAVIRFTETVIPFQGALSRAVKSAEASGQHPFYEVVTTFPQKRSYFNNADEQANEKAQSVIDVLRQEGISENRIRLSKQASTTASFQEVHVFLR